MAEKKTQYANMPEGGDAPKPDTAASYEPAIKATGSYHLAQKYQETSQKVEQGRRLRKFGRKSSQKELDDLKREIEMVRAHEHIRSVLSGAHIHTRGRAALLLAMCVWQEGLHLLRSQLHSVSTLPSCAPTARYFLFPNAACRILQLHANRPAFVVTREPH